MKVATSLCAVVVFLCVSLSLTRAQTPSCAPGSQIGSNTAALLPLLLESPSNDCRVNMLELVKVQDFVAEAQTVFAALSFVCQQPCLNYVRNFAEQCVPVYVQVLGLACGRNDQYFCYQSVAFNNGTDVLMQCFPEQFQPGSPMIAEGTTTDNDTATYPPMTSFNCSSGCQTALQSFRALHGCCVTNAFNSTAFDLLQFGLANYSLWSACEVETIAGYCSSPFTVDTTTPPSTTQPLATDSSIVFAAHTLLPVLAVLMTFFVLF